jgi:ATP-dependent DNA helicase Rep
MSDRLNKAQSKAVRYVDGPLLVLAGAGTGKTRVITHKIAYLIGKGGFEPSEVAAVTFTNKASREMRKRIQPLIGRKAASQLRLSTFHRLGMTILRESHNLLGYKSNFTIIDQNDAIALVRDALRASSMARDGEPERWLAQISRWKAAGLDAEAAGKTVGDDRWLLTVAHAYVDYEQALRTYNAVDLDDLILLPVQLLGNHKKLLGEWRRRIRYLLVDEYQDTNIVQYEMIKLLVGKRGCLTVVGDDDQSIYAWRGARPENLELIAKDMPSLKVVKLQQNYRSALNILSAANALIANNPHLFDKALWSERGQWEPIRVMQAADEYLEAEKVVSTIAHHKLINTNSWADYALLYRSNHQSRLFEQALRERNIPYQLSGGTSFFSYGEVKDLIAYLRLIANPDEDNAFLRIINTPRRELGQTSIEHIADVANQNRCSLYAAAMEHNLHVRLTGRASERLREFVVWLDGLAERADEDVAATLDDIIASTNYRDWLRDTSATPEEAERRLSNVDELANWMRRVQATSDGGLAEILGTFAIMDALDREEEDAGERMRLMTLHAAKGLEFDHVYLVGMEENILPHRASIEFETVEEERRLCYVGITRARKTLVLSLAARRRRYGETQSCLPSRFLDELPAEELEWQRDGASTQSDRKTGRKTLDGLRDMLEDL